MKEPPVQTDFLSKTVYTSKFDLHANQPITVNSGHLPKKREALTNDF